MDDKIKMPQICLRCCRFKPFSETMISRLINDIYFFLHRVLIINIDDDYRLLVIKNNRVLWDKKYKSVRGARVAFAKLFLEMGWKKGVKPQWSHMYPPDEDWLDNILKEAESCNQA